MSNFGPHINNGFFFLFFSPSLSMVHRSTENFISQKKKKSSDSIWSDLTSGTYWDIRFCYEIMWSLSEYPNITTSNRKEGNHVTEKGLWPFKSNGIKSNQTEDRFHRFSCQVNLTLNVASTLYVATPRSHTSCFQETSDECLVLTTAVCDYKSLNKTVTCLPRKTVEKLLFLCVCACK